MYWLHTLTILPNYTLLFIPPFTLLREARVRLPSWLHIPYLFLFFFVHTSCPYSHPAPFLFFFFFFSLCQIVRRGTKAYPLLLIINHVSCRIAWLHDEQQMDRCRGTIITGGEGERIGANLKLRSLPGLQEGAAVLKKKKGGEGRVRERKGEKPPEPLRPVKPFCFFIRTNLA